MFFIYFSLVLFFLGFIAGIIAPLSRGMIDTVRQFFIIFALVFGLLWYRGALSFEIFSDYESMASGFVRGFFVLIIVGFMVGCGFKALIYYFRGIKFPE